MGGQVGLVGWQVGRWLAVSFGVSRVGRWLALGGLVAVSLGSFSPGIHIWDLLFVSILDAGLSKRLFAEHVLHH